MMQCFARAATCLRRVLQLPRLTALAVAMGLACMPLDGVAATKRGKTKASKVQTVKVSKASKVKIRLAKGKQGKHARLAGAQLKKGKLALSRKPSRLARKARAEMLAGHAMRGGKLRKVAALPMMVGGLPALYSSAALVVNAVSGERIFDKNSQAVVPIASITKLMTAMVVLDMHLPLHEEIEIAPEDIDTLKGSSSRLMVGTRLSRGEMMHLALMSSENRAAHALARTAPGGSEAFIARMNRTAQSLGMRHTRFLDPTGLNSGNVASAEDLARLVQASYFYPEIKHYSTAQELRFVSSVNGREQLFRNTNPLVRSDSWDIGVSKTGYINEAGKCLVMRAVIEGAPVVIVLLDSAGKLARIGDANRIKKWLETDPAAKLRAG